MAKFILIIIVSLGFMVFLGTYEGLNLLYFEENSADGYAIKILIPLLVLSFIILLVQRYQYSIKENRLIDALKYSVGGIFGLGIGSYFLLVPVISGAIIFTNDVLRSKATIISGIVSNKIEIDGGKLGENELTIQTPTRTITLDTNKVETDKYKIGDAFSVEMMEGYWGLLSKRK